MAVVKPEPGGVHQYRPVIGVVTLEKFISWTLYENKSISFISCAFKIIIITNTGISKIIIISVVMMRNDIIISLD